MKDNSTFFEVDYPSEQAVAWMIQRLSEAGLLVSRTFDLRSARLAQPSCSCPHHGTDPCDCQLVVLMVYQITRTPLAITAHGYDQQTTFAFVDTPQQRADPRLESYIRDLVAPYVINSNRLANELVT